MYKRQLNDNSIQMKYQLTKKSSTIENSGIKVVNRIFSPNIIGEAHNIRSLLEIAKAKSGDKNANDDVDEKTINQIKRIHNLVAILKECAGNEKVLLNLEKLRELNADFIEKFEG